MNCKPGDLAIVVRSATGLNAGKICLVKNESRMITQYGFCWLVEFPHPIKWASGHITREGWAGDADMRPIRDSDGTDETLRQKEEVS